MEIFSNDFINNFFLHKNILIFYHMDHWQKISIEVMKQTPIKGALRVQIIIIYTRVVRPRKWLELCSDVSGAATIQK